MKYLTLESFIRSLPEEDIWKIINEYEKWYLFEDAPRHSLLWEKSEEYCHSMGIRPVDIRIVSMGAYRHFALKYKEIMNEEVS
jgi:hypothetical protein